MLPAMPDLKAIYNSRFHDLQRAETELERQLQEVVATIEDKALVRAEVRNTRIKELSSLERKAEAKGWKPEDALTYCDDLIGGRVLCNNIEDVYRFVELLKERLPDFWTSYEVQDHIAMPNDGGYRAVHVNFRLNISDSALMPDLVPCEVQVRSRLQDAWAELSHDDIYKQENLPDDLRARFKDLAEVLAAADKISGDIRSRIAQEVTSPQQQPSLKQVSQDGLAYVFKGVFGRSPREYAVRQALNLCGQLGIASLEGLPEILGRGDFRDKLEETYRSIIPVPFGAEEMLLASLYALAKDDERAIKWVRQSAQRERREVEAYARREVLSSMPETMDELVEHLEGSSSVGEIESWADALGASSNCLICGEPVVDPVGFAEGAADFYELSSSEADESMERLQSAIVQSGAEVGGWGGGELCAYHHEQALKDD